MKGKSFVLMIVAAPWCVTTQGATQHPASLAQLPAYAADAVFEVLLPQSEDPVAYNVRLQSSLPQAPDSLAPCDYLIDWDTETPGGTARGFSAYFNGHHYRYRNNRLQEYHMESNPATFLPAGAGSESAGVQCTAQFADLLPQFLGRRIGAMAADSAYIYTVTTDTIVDRLPSVVVEGVKRNAGYDVAEFCYVFDAATGLPRRSEVTNSPGAISEQIVTVHYLPPTLPPVSLDEDGLIAAYPDAFELYRQSTFRAENLPGSPLPAFACRTLGTSERYSHQSDEDFPATTLIVVLDPAVATTAETVASIREAVDMLPMQTDVIWAFTTNHESEAMQAIGTLRSGETALLSAGSLVRACGITLYPTTLVVGRDAVVKYVLPGYNNGLEELVIQKCML